LQAAGEDFSLTKKEVDEISKATKTALVTDFVKPAGRRRQGRQTRAKLKGLEAHRHR
jgi:hypothetical protein